MNTNFSFIKPGELDNWGRISLSFPVMGSTSRDTAFEMVSLASSASAFFCGLFPVTPYFPDEFSQLPWYDEYHTTVDDTGIRRSSIAPAVARVAAQLDKAHPAAGLAEWGPVTYHSVTLAGSSRTILQGLAVETMLLADGCVKRLTQDNLLAALSWLTAAYRRIMDCTRQAQDIIELGNGPADQAADQKINPPRPGRSKQGRRTNRACAAGNAIRPIIQCNAESVRPSKARRRHRRR